MNPMLIELIAFFLHLFYKARIITAEQYLDIHSEIRRLITGNRSSVDEHNKDIREIIALYPDRESEAQDYIIKVREKGKVIKPS
jgi:hypothetical protein